MEYLKSVYNIFESNPGSLADYLTLLVTIIGIALPVWLYYRDNTKKVKSMKFQGSRPEEIYPGVKGIETDKRTYEIGIYNPSNYPVWIRFVGVRKGRNPYVRKLRKWMTSISVLNKCVSTDKVYPVKYNYELSEKKNKGKIVFYCVEGRSLSNTIYFDLDLLCSELDKYNINKDYFEFVFREIEGQSHIIRIRNKK